VSIAKEKKKKKVNKDLEEHVFVPFVVLMDEAANALGTIALSSFCVTLPDCEVKLSRSITAVSERSCKMECCHCLLTAR